MKAILQHIFVSHWVTTAAGFVVGSLVPALHATACTTSSTKDWLLGAAVAALGAAAKDPHK